MKPTYLRAVLSSCAVAFALAFSSAHAQNIAVVNGKPIPKAQADQIVAQLVKNGQKDSPELEQAVRDQLIEREILLQEADKRGLTKDPEVEAQIDRQRQQVLIAAVAQEYFKANPPSDQEVRARYDEIIKNMPAKEYKAHHILVEKEADAKAIIAKLKAGASFDDLAKQSSKDPGSAAKGGELDWAPANAYAGPFGDALTKLQKGQLTQTPVKTEYGYHVIRLDDVRDRPIPSFEQAKPRVIEIIMQDQHWQQAKFKALLDDLRAKAKVE
ncbi:MAG: peptidylprolyl isomerase [Burkholderiaceae bacterium]|jgi:peptidyl-prolyl cis-trans isomerase C